MEKVCEWCLALLKTFCGFRLTLKIMKLNQPRKFYLPYSGKFSEGETFANFGKNNDFQKYNYFLIFFVLIFKD